MKALIYQGPEKIAYENVADPTPDAVEGAVVRVARAGICGSDLHIYHGHGFSPDTGYTVGHESVGEVVEVGSGVQRFRTGDRVLIPGSAGCASCDPCRRGDVLLCANGRAACYGLSHALEGSQAEAVAVPAADTSLVRIPDGISDEQALLLTDNLPTAWYGARHGAIRPGQTVAVVGLGPVGLCSVMSALAMGGATVWAVDLVEERRALAETLGAVALRSADPASELQALTGGRGADVVLEAVGSDATIQLALQLVTRGGCVSVVGVSQTHRFPFPMALAQFMAISFHIGLTSVQAELPALIPLVQSGRLKPELAISHRMGLSQGVEAYRLFADRSGGAMKMVLDPRR